MPVVQIGPMPVGVLGGFMFMPVGMIGAARRISMAMRVMVIIVGVVVPMRNGIMAVGVLMLLAEERHEGGGNDHSRQRL